MNPIIFRAALGFIAGVTIVSIMGPGPVTLIVCAVAGIAIGAYK